MDLDEYLWRTKRTLADFSRALDVSQPTISKIKQKRVSPKLLIAMKIIIETGGKVSLDEIISKKDIRELETWRHNLQ